MIQTTSGSTTLQPMESARHRPGSYTRIEMSSAYVDEFRLVELEHFATALERDGSAVLDFVVNRPLVGLLQRWLSEPPRLHLQGRDELHPKAYPLLRMNPLASEGLITSSNLTEGGIGHSPKVGVRLGGADPRAARDLGHKGHHVTNSERSIQ